MKSDELDVADLLANDSFINYCKGTSVKDIFFWETYVATHPDRRQMVEDARDKFVMLFNALAKADMAEQLSLMENKLSQKTAQTVVEIGKENQHGNYRKHFTLLFKVSAAAILLAVATFFWVNNYSAGKSRTSKIFASSCGERKNIQLPDGSIVTLNAASKIEIDESFGHSSRNVYLEGEAFFDVKHNAAIPFIVHTPMMDVKALGTAFDVKAYLSDKATETSLIRGLVEITLKESENRVMLLHPNQKIRWVHPARNEAGTHSSIQTETKTNPANGLARELKPTNSGSIKEIAWTENKLIFEDERLEEISRLISRWYGVNIHFKDDAIRDYRFTGMFEKEDLNTVLGFLKESRHFNYEIEAGDPITVNLFK